MCRRTYENVSKTNGEKIMELSDILSIIVGCIGLIISTIAIIISIHSIKRQTKMDLFDKRYSYYYACDLICRLSSIEQPLMVEKRLEIQKVSINDFSLGCTTFLFDKELSDLILSIFSQWRFMIDYCYIKENEDTKVDKKETIKKIEELKAWFLDQKEILRIKFTKYLNLINKG